MNNQFTAFTSKHDTKVNVLKTNVIVSSITTLNTNGKSGNYLAIWDTGATSTVVSKKIAAEFGLTPIGKIQVSTASGKDICNQYLVSILLPNKLSVPDIIVTEGTLSGCDVLIGMDIIGCGDLSVTNVDNKTVFSFRYPSCEVIDYCKEAQKIKAKIIEKKERELQKQLKQHGNERCTCGSGKKYRYCHGKLEMLPTVKEKVKID